MPSDHIPCPTESHEPSSSLVSIRIPTDLARRLELERERLKSSMRCGELSLSQTIRSLLVRALDGTPNAT